MFEKISFIAAVLAVLGLVGCAAPDQDNGSADIQVSIRAIDGYITRAQIFQDFDQDGIKDTGEVGSAAQTDKDGYTSSSPTGGQDDASVDHCAADATEPENCFKVSAGQAEAMVRVSSGYSKTISESFVGVISRKIAVNSISANSVLVISPITSLMSTMTDIEIARFVITEAGDLTAADMSSDYLNFANDLTPAKRTALFSMALLLHKSADVISVTLNSALFGGRFGDSAGLPNDATHLVYLAIQENLGTVKIADVMANNANVVIAAAISKMSEVSTNVGLVGSNATSNSATFTKIVALSSLISTLFASDLTFPTDNPKGDAYSRARAIEVVVNLMRSNGMTTAPNNAINRALQAATTDADSATYLSNLQNDKFSLTSLVNKFLAGTYVDASSADYSARASLDTSSPINIADGGGSSVGIEFNEDGTMSLTGTLDLGGETSATFTEGEPLNGTYEQIDDGTIIMTVEPIPGVSQSYVMKTNDDGTGYLVDICGELVEWN